jgi:hypothetical protein
MSTPQNNKGRRHKWGHFATGPCGRRGSEWNAHDRFVSIVRSSRILSLRGRGVPRGVRLLKTTSGIESIQNNIRLKNIFFYKRLSGKAEANRSDEFWRQWALFQQMEQLRLILDGWYAKITSSREKYEMCVLSSLPPKVKKVQPGRKIRLKKTISQICYPQKVLIWADLGIRDWSKVQRHIPPKKNQHIFSKLEYFLQTLFTYNPVAGDMVLSTNDFENSY